MLSHVGHTILGMNSVQLYMKIPGCRTPGKCHLSSRMDLVGQKQHFFPASVVLLSSKTNFSLGQHFQELGHRFLLNGPPSRQITYNSMLRRFVVVFLDVLNRVYPSSHPLSKEKNVRIETYYLCNLHSFFFFFTNRSPRKQ